MNASRQVLKMNKEKNTYNGGPWSQALKEKLEKHIREKHGIKLKKTEN